MVTDSKPAPSGIDLAKVIKQLSIVFVAYTLLVASFFYPFAGIPLVPPRSGYVDLVNVVLLLLVVIASFTCAFRGSNENTLLKSIASTVFVLIFAAASNLGAFVTIGAMESLLR